MNLRQQVEKLRDEARSLASKNDASIDPLRLSMELDRILDQSDRVSERLWRKYQWRMELWKETRLEMSRAVISFGQGAIRSLTLINGGAAVAVMTFIGNFRDADGRVTQHMANALLLFSIGVVAAAIVASFAYITQFFYEHGAGRLSKLGKAFHGAAVCFAAVSAGLFVAGILKAYAGFLVSG